MANSNTIQVTLQVRDDGSVVVKGFAKNTEDSLKKTEANAERFFAKIKKNWLAISASVFAAYQIINKGWNLAEQAAQYEQSRAAFASMASSMGADADKLYAELRAKSAELIDKKALIESANRAMSLGIPVEKLGALMEVARAKARDMGISTTQAFNDIATGVGRGSPLILDNLGLVMKVGAANEALAKSLNKSVDALTEQEKKTAILNATLDAGQEALERYDMAVLTSKEKMEKLEATVKDLQLWLGQALIRGAAGAVGAFQAMAAGALKLYEWLMKLGQGYAWLRSKMSFGEESARWKAVAEEFKRDAEAASGAAADLWGKAKDNFAAMVASQAEMANVMRKNNKDANDDIIKASEEAAEKRLELQKHLTDAIKQMTLSEAEYKIWALNQEVAEMRKVAGENQALQNQISTYRKLMLAEMVKDFEAAYAQIGKTEFDLARAAVEEQALAWQQAGADKIRVAEWVAAQVKEIYERENADNIRAMEEFNQKYSELGKSSFDVERMQLAEQVEAWRKAGADKEALEKYTAAKITEINALESQARMESLRSLAGSMSATFKEISEMGGQYGREAFMMYKAFKIVEIAIATKDAAMKAYSAMVGYPYVGPALAVAAAAAAVAFGAAQAAAVANAQPPSYDEGGVSTKPGMYYSGVPEAHIPLKSGAVPVEISGGRQEKEREREIRLDIANIVSPELLDSYLASPRGQSAMLNVIGARAQTVRRVLRG